MRGRPFKNGFDSRRDTSGVSTLETRRKISEAKKGEKNAAWKGGITPIHRIIRTSSEYRIWHKAVLERDKYQCIWCGNKKNLHADHIRPFARFPELRFAIDNGRTLCEDCHKTTDSWGRNC